MAWKKEKGGQGGRQDIVELGKDTDANVCTRLKGKLGSDGICRLVETGLGTDGDIHIKPIVNRDGENK